MDSFVVASPKMDRVTSPRYRCEPGRCLHWKQARRFVMYTPLMVLRTGWKRIAKLQVPVPSHPCPLQSPIRPQPPRYNNQEKRYELAGGTSLVLTYVPSPRARPTPWSPLHKFPPCIPACPSYKERKTNMILNPHTETRKIAPHGAPVPRPAAPNLRPGDLVI